MFYSNNTFVMHSPSVHQMEPRQPTLKVLPSIPLEQKTLMHSMVPQSLYNIMSPPFYSGPSHSISVTRADLMTIEQTANWIWTVGVYRGWTEAETYATNFRENSITGKLLPLLTNDQLEFSLGVTKTDHRNELLSTIQYLFPNMTINNNHFSPKLRSSVRGIDILQSPCNSESSDQQHPIELGNPNSYLSYESDADCESVTSYLVSACPTVTDETSQMDCSDMMSESGNSKFCSMFGCVGSDCNQDDDPLKMPLMTGVRKSGVFEKGMTKKDVIMVEKPAVSRHGNGRRQLRCKKLQVTLTINQFSRDEYQMERIRSRFEEMKFYVKVQPAEKNAQTYIITFKDSTEATNALLQANEIGYPLCKKWPTRPSPNRPIQYKSLTELIIREGKAFSGNEVGILRKGEIVTVNQVKGRRARLVKPNEDGELVTWGWVSLHNQSGDTLLIQVNEE